jgi:hypothetical protein
MDRGRGCPLTSLEPRTSDRVLVLGEGFLDELDRVLDPVEGFLGELKLVLELELVKGFLEELKLVLVLVELFCLLVQQLCLPVRAVSSNIAREIFFYSTQSLYGKTFLGKRGGGIEHSWALVDYSVIGASGLSDEDDGKNDRLN